MKAIHNLNHRIRARQRGSILVICMVLAGVGAIGAAAFFALIQAKTEETEHAKTNVERRAKQANSVALAKEILFRKYVDAETGPAAAETHTLPGGWGEVTISPFTEKPLGTTAATRTNKSSAIPARAYTVDVDVSVDDGDIAHKNQFQIKSCSPNLGGDLLYLGEPTLSGGSRNTIDGDIRVKGRARLWTGGSNHTVSIKADQYIGADSATPNLALSDTAGNPLLGQNFPFVKLTSGRHGGAGSAPSDGTLSAIVNGDTPWNTYSDRIANSGDFAEVDGDVPVGGGAGLPTRPPGPNDAVLLAMIANRSPWGNIRDAFELNLPLSSQVMDEWIRSAFPAGQKFNILMLNMPLPLDILQHVIDETFQMNGDQRINLLDAHAAAGGSVGGGAFTSDGNGGLTLDLDATEAKHIAAKNVQSLAISGQGDPASFAAAGDLEPLIVMIHNDGASTKILQSIEFKEQNNRRMILAVKQENSSDPVVLTHTGGTTFPEWRGLIHLENAPLSINVNGVGGGVTLKGGCWTDRSLRVPSGTLTIERETDPGALERMTARIAWLEAFRN